MNRRELLLGLAAQLAAGCAGRAARPAANAVPLSPPSRQDPGEPLGHFHDASSIRTLSAQSMLLLTRGALVSAVGDGISVVNPKTLAKKAHIDLDADHLCELAPGIIACLVEGPDLELARIEVATRRVERLPVHRGLGRGAMAATDPNTVYVRLGNGVQRLELRAGTVVSHLPARSPRSSTAPFDQLLALADGRVVKPHIGTLEIYRGDRREAEIGTGKLLAHHLASASNGRLWLTDYTSGTLVLARLGASLEIEQRFDFGPARIVSLGSGMGRAAVVLGYEDRTSGETRWETAVVTESGALRRRIEIPRSFCPPGFVAFVAPSDARVVACRLDGAMLGWDI